VLLGKYEAFKSVLKLLKVFFKAFKSVFLKRSEVFNFV